MVRHKLANLKGLVTKAMEFQLCRWCKTENEIGTLSSLASLRLARADLKKRKAPVACPKMTYDSD